LRAEKDKRAASGQDGAAKTGSEHITTNDQTIFAAAK
jgi:hypothetical protein